MLARLSLVLLLIAPPALALERLFVVGEARSMKDGELRYREYHHCSEDRSKYFSLGSQFFFLVGFLKFSQNPFKATLTGMVVAKFF